MNPNEYGPMNGNSPHHGNLDEPTMTTFQPYAELPFTAMKRRRQLQNEGTSLVKWAMRGVLLSPVIVLVLWSVVALVFTSSNQNHGLRNSNRTNSLQQQQQQTRRRGVLKRMLPNFMGSTDTNTQLVYMQPEQQQQQQSDTMMMVVSPKRHQQSQLQEGNGMMMVVSPNRKQATLQEDTNGMRMVVSPNRKQATLQEDTNGMMMVVSPNRKQSTVQADTNGMRMVVSPNRKQATLQEDANVMRMVVSQKRQQSQDMGQVSDQQYLVIEQPPQGSSSSTSSSTMQQQSQTGFDAEALPPQVVVVTDPIYMAVQEQEHALPLIVESSTMSVGHPVMTSVGNGQTIDASNGSNINNRNEIQSAVSMQQQQQPLELADSSAIVEPQFSPIKQAIYYYDPKDAALSQNGDIMRLPQLVYDANGKAILLSELQHAPIYVQPPLLGDTVSGGSSSSTSSFVSASDISSSSSASDYSIDRLDRAMVAPAREAVKIPKWGESTSQDQTVIVATVAVMALLVGALSARRLRSKSFLASCIENETLEDDLAYDSAYTTTAGGHGGGGGGAVADSSYHTFGGWKGDLEKFDV
jgi:hypothetical protein